MPEAESAVPSTVPGDLPASAKANLIFISHDSRDAEIAEAFSKLLGSVSLGVLKTFRSSDKQGTQGIAYGAEWYPELMAKLEAASDVVCLLTQRSLDRPWILFEAGVAKGRLNTAVYGIALGIPLSCVQGTGPFAQFQNCDDQEEPLTKLVLQLVRRIPGAEPDRDVILGQVRVFREQLGQILARPGNAEPAPARPDLVCVPLAEQQVARDREQLVRLLRGCRASEVVRLISITSKWMFEPQTFISGAGSPLEAALQAGVKIKGILLDPRSPAAATRSSLQSPGIADPAQAMLARNAAFVAQRIRLLKQLFPDAVDFRYAAEWVTFQLWLFPEVAVVEPYHLAQLEPACLEHALCGFARLTIPAGTTEYSLALHHFDALWAQAVEL